jgi:two-component system chemotaxis sensor kinase CheA
MDLRNIGKINVLIVEDDSFNVHLISALLKKIADVEITATDDGKEALAILESGDKAIDVVLLDLHMPKMDGKDVLTAIRQQSKYNNIPVIIISVDGLDEDELLKLGADDFVLKPFDIDKFAAVLAKQLS